MDRRIGWVWEEGTNGPGRFGQEGLDFQLGFELLGIHRAVGPQEMIEGSLLKSLPQWPKTAETDRFEHVVLYSSPVAELQLNDCTTSDPRESFMSQG